MDVRSAVSAYEQAKHHVTEVWTATCTRADRIGAAAVQADKVVAAASQCIGFERLHRLDKWAVKTLESVSHRIELLSRSQHPLAVKVMRVLERNGLNLVPRLEDQSGARKAGREFGDEFWLAKLSERASPLQPATAYSAPSPADSEILSQASTRGCGSSRQISPATAEGPDKAEFKAQDLFTQKGVAGQPQDAKRVTGENPSTRGVDGWVPELQLMSPRLASDELALPAAPVTLETILASANSLLPLVPGFADLDQDLGCNPEGHAIVCGGHYEF